MTVKKILVQIIEKKLKFWFRLWTMNFQGQFLIWGGGGGQNVSSIFGTITDEDFMPKTDFE